MADKTFSLSNSAKIEYLNSAIGKIHKILHLVEEEEKTGFSPNTFMAGFLFELNAANDLFDGKLVQVIIKIKGIKDNYKTIQFCDIKKQIFEIKRIINHILKDLEG